MPPLAKIRPGMPAPTMGPGTGDGILSLYPERRSTKRDPTKQSLAFAIAVFWTRWIAAFNAAIPVVQKTLGRFVAAATPEVQAEHGDCRKAWEASSDHRAGDADRIAAVDDEERFGSIDRPAPLRVE
jgi:hypothetical protein